MQQNYPGITIDIPVGIQDFMEVRSGGLLYYVDKTDLIAHILDKPGTKVFLYTRPRRFGKSINLSMLDAFLNMEYKGNSWFDGLKISERKDLEEFKNIYPVLYFDFKNSTVETYCAFIERLSDKISQLYEDHGDILDSEIGPISRKNFNDLMMGPPVRVLCVCRFSS